MNELTNENEYNEEELDSLLSNFANDEDIDINAFMDFFNLDINDLDDHFEKPLPTIEVQYIKENPEVKSPTYAYPTDSGFDLYTTEDKWLHPFDRVLIPTGLYIDIPENYEIQIRSKSGLALKQGLMVLNSPGTVDQGYTGEIQVILFNTTNQKVKIEKGQKVAQAVISPVVSGKWLTFVEKETIETKDRSDNGFGSTGL